MKRKIVIVGGVAGGATAAARLRRLNETDEIVLLERGEHISFANCGLPYYIGEKITQRQKLLVQTVEGMSSRFQLDIRNQSEVISINRPAKSVRVRNLKTGESYEESYDILVLSPGAKPIKPPIPGIEEAEALFTLRSIPDTDAIKDYVDTKSPRHAVVIGGGFIGVEMAENLRERGLDVTLVEMSDQVLPPLDPEMAAFVHEHMRSKGVDLLLGDAVQAFKQKGTTVALASGKEIPTDMIVLAIGVQPESQLAKDAGLELGVRGAIRVNDTLQTSDPAIYAIGDAIAVKDWITGEETMVPLAWGANRQGRLVADHINGLPVSYKGALGTAIVKVFDLTVATTGNNEKSLRKRGRSFEAVHIHPASHASYYPGSSPVSLKLLFEPQSGKILGAQAVSADGADKRIDVIATAIKGGLTIHDLPDLELAYAPPYSSAKDPVNMLGYVAANVAEGRVKTVQWHEIDQIVAAGGLLIDVRERIEREMGFIPGSVNIPLGELRGLLDEIPSEGTIYVSCQVGQRGYVAARILSQYGFDVRNVDGGYKTYAAVFGKGKGNAPATPGNQPSPIVPTENASANTASPANEAHPIAHVTVDTCGLQCPGPIMQVYKALEGMKEGEVAAIISTDPGFASDIEQWCARTGNILLQTGFDKQVCTVYIRKGLQNQEPDAVTKSQEGATLIVFSGDLDKAMASFIIASGAAAMGKPVTMFFTFWGLNLLRRAEAPAVDKTGLEKMFGMMMPKGPAALPLSKMNMAGLGAKFMQYAMEQKNVDSLQTLMKNAQEAGVKLIACTMSMDIMGIKREELIDGVDLGGVATYLGHADQAGLNLFI